MRRLCSWRTWPILIKGILTDAEFTSAKAKILGIYSLTATLMEEVDAYVRLAGVYDTMVVDPCYPAWADFLQDRWRSDRVGVTSVLHVCCGTGLMAAELSARHYQVLGTDASPEMLATAREVGLRG